MINNFLFLVGFGLLSLSLYANIPVAAEAFPLYTGEKYNQSEKLFPDYSGDTGDLFNDSSTSDDSPPKKKYLLSITAMRWIPGGLSIGIFVFYTLGVCYKVYSDKQQPEPEKQDLPDVTDESFFRKTDVIAKLKTGKKTFLQRRIMANKQKKFVVYNKMMRKYRDDVILRKKQEQRHAEIQKEREEKEAVAKAAKELEIERLRQKSLRIKQRKSTSTALPTLEVYPPSDKESSGSLEVPSVSSSSSLRENSSGDSLITPHVTFQCVDESNDVKPISLITSDEEMTKNVNEDQGLVMKLNPKSSAPDEVFDAACINAEVTPIKEIKPEAVSLDTRTLETLETRFVTRDSSDDEETRRSKHILTDLPTVQLFQSTEELDAEVDENGEMLHLKPMLTECALDSSGDENMKDEIPIRSRLNARRFIQDSAFSRSMDTEASGTSGASGGETVDEMGDSLTVLRKSNRPFTWALGENDTDSIAKTKLPDEESEKIDDMIGCFVRNALETRGLVSEEEGIGHDTGASGKGRKYRPRTWSVGVESSEGQADSITELIAKFMDLGPAKRKGRPLSFDQKDEDKMLVELERRIVQSIHEDNIPVGDVDLLENLINEYLHFYEEY